MADNKQDPRNPSNDYKESKPYWDMVDAILCGVEKMRMQNNYTQAQAAAGPRQPYATLNQLSRSNTRLESPYLPRFPAEGDMDYELRRKNAPLANIYADISSNLAGKPFAKTLDVADDTADDLKKIADNIDGQGNNLHTFGRKTFKDGIDRGIDWILVDMPQVSPGATLEQERVQGVRPYWVHIPADKLIAVYSDFVSGIEIITHARIYECYSERDGYTERDVERVRVFNREPLGPDENAGYAPATWELWELQEGEDANNKSLNWVQIDGGDITIGIIPLVPFVAGARDGARWRVDAPLKSLAYMQVEEFQQESNLKNIKELAAFPMLAGDGITLGKDGEGNDVEVKMGPHYILTAPPTSDGTIPQWHFIEPAGSSLTFLQADLEKFRAEMRNLGMQPMATANLTVVTTANVSMKAHSAVQAWALGLKDALERAWAITCQWLNKTDEVTVNVHTDFGVDMEAGHEIDSLIKADAQGILSKKTVWDELKRRGVLSDDFDPDEEEQRLAEQQQGQLVQPEVAIDPVTGQQVQPSTRPFALSKPVPVGTPNPVPGKPIGQSAPQKPGP
jgi:Domain of unknown function (DUF4055)